MSAASEIIDLTKNLKPGDKELIERACAFSEKVHAEQKRYSGEPYFNHIVEVTKSLANLGMDAKIIAAGLLHDVLEDAHVSEENLRKEFGDEIAFLVQGVTKLGKLKYRGLERHVESLRKFFVAVAQNIGIVIIKLVDRLHNVSTLEHVPKEEKRRRIALETLEIYAPIADRLGMWRLKAELEDHSFKYAYPKEYEEISRILKESRRGSREYLERFYKSLQKTLAENGVRNAKVDYRIKHLYGLYKKWLRHNKDIEKIYDVVALRVITDTIENCYKILGIVHKTWRPLPGRIKDYMALPKPNGYRSLHTTVFTGDGGIVEIQIRTKEMHDKAEYGVASHLVYKESQSDKRARALSGNLSWINQLIEWQENVSKTGEYLDRLKMDFFKNRVFVFTPKGDVIDLPEDSSPVDFAYAIHSDIGSRMSGAKVNGKLISLNTKLKNGDIVQIVTKEGAKPSSKWLHYAKTHLARKQIKSQIQKLSPLRRFLS